jgi:nitrogen regulatory protein P-II 1
MKRVEVVMPPAKLDEIKDALAGVGISGMTVSEARVFGPAARRREVYLGSSCIVDFARKVKIEIMVRDDVVLDILEALKNSPTIGDGDDTKVFISDIVEVVRIRTGERGEAATAYAASSPPSAEAELGVLRPWSLARV